MSARSKEKLSPELETAFEALASYASGGRRSALFPIDAAVAQSTEKPASRDALEQRLQEVLTGTAPATAKQYACNKLAIIGTGRSAPHLARLLHEPAIATDARTALEAIPDEAASKVILRELAKLEGTERAGAIASLAARDCKSAVRVIKRELDSSDPVVRQAAAAALKSLQNT